MSTLPHTDADSLKEESPMLGPPWLKMKSQLTSTQIKHHTVGSMVGQGTASNANKTNKLVPSHCLIVKPDRVLTSPES